ncbi:MAG: amino acid ABC transporter permease [Halofilum sp. (in: g-proteobacteria)]
MGNANDQTGYGLLRLLRRIHWGYGVALLVGVAVVAILSSGTTGSGEGRNALGSLIAWIPFILNGFVLNLVMSFLAMALATVLGIGLGLLQLGRSLIVRKPAVFVTHLFRNSPWLVILFVVMYYFPFEVRVAGSKVSIPGWIPATLAFALPVMANISEIVRGAINSIPNTQWESAASLALTRRQTLRHVILPQCVKRSIPPWMNWYAMLTLATPMASILGVDEAVGNAQAALESAGSRPELLVPFYGFLLLLFFAYIYPIAILTHRLERKYGFKS